MCPDINVSLKEIDEALKYALETRATTQDSKKHIIDHFINDLLDERSRLTK